MKGKWVISCLLLMVLLFGMVVGFAQAQGSAPLSDVQSQGVVSTPVATTDANQNGRLLTQSPIHSGPTVPMDDSPIGRPTSQNGVLFTQPPMGSVATVPVDNGPIGELENQNGVLLTQPLMRSGPTVPVDNRPISEPPSQNGVLLARPPMHSGPTVPMSDVPIGGLWQEFSFTGVGVPARGCAPVDPGGPSCAPSSGGNSVFAPAPPWTFVAPAEGVDLTMVEAFLVGDQFDIFDAGAYVGTTSPPYIDGSCGDDPVPCFANPSASSGVFWLAPGPHSITIIPVASPFGGGAAYFRTDVHVSILIGGPWQEISFTGVGVPARGCAPADPGGFDCAPSSGGNSVFAPAPPWTFIAPPEGVNLTVVDAFEVGDQFDIFDAGAYIGATSPPVGGGSCGDDPVPCLADPNVSSGVFWLAPGPHAITIVPVASSFEYWAAYFRVVINSPPLLSGLPDVLVDHTTTLPDVIDSWAYAIDAETSDSGLTYNIEGSPPSGAGVSIVGNRWLTIDPSTSWCSYTDVTLRVTDPSGLWDEDTLRVAVTWSCLSYIPVHQLNRSQEIVLQGPESLGLGMPNPFMIEAEVTFTEPEGETYTMPAFYDGDGVGGMDGYIWKVRFNPDALGLWTYTSSSTEPLLDGHSGVFEVADAEVCHTYIPGGLPDFSCVGRLEHSSNHYLRFANGSYWLKGGEDDPEDFLAPGNTVGFSSKQEAIDYLAANGVNSLYMMLHNIGGDGRNVWPWVGADSDEAQANHERFDLVKLDEWENIFSYLQDNGIVLHLVLEDDSGWTGFNRYLYYREMIARFGHHNGLIWNISEEFNENYTADEVKSFAQLVRDLDPYDHPITVHLVGPLNLWLPFLGDDRFDVTSFQTAKVPVNPEAASWYQLAEDSSRTIAVSFDETGKIQIADQDLSRHIVWSAYMGGANFELHSFPLTSYLDFATHLADMTRARKFVEELPFWDMRPMNELLVSGKAYIFAKQGELYSAYLPSGGSIEIDLTSTASSYDGKWFNPRDGSMQIIGNVQGGTVRTFSSPTGDDWVLLLGLSLVTLTPNPTFTANIPPTISGLPDVNVDETTILPFQIDLWAYASDAETPDSGLTYTIEGLPPPGAGVEIVDNRWLIIDPSTSWCSYTDVTIRVTDPGGLWDEDTLRVAVTWSCTG